MRSEFLSQVTSILVFLHLLLCFRLSFESLPAFRLFGSFPQVQFFISLYQKITGESPVISVFKSLVQKMLQIFSPYFLWFLCCIDESNLAKLSLHSCAYFEIYGLSNIRYKEIKVFCLNMHFWLHTLKKYKMSVAFHDGRF